MLKSADISVVIQGPVSKQYTIACLKSIRRFLPNAEIILSTTMGTDCSELEYDQLVLTKDPGASLIDKENNVYNNINRQIMSTKSGLAVATRKYALKFRSDMTLDGVKWIDIFGRYDVDCPATLFENRVLICNYYTRNPRVLPIPFHPSDWIMFGKTEDLKKYYNIKFQSLKEILWFDTMKKGTKLFGHMLSRYTPEQYLCKQFLVKFKKISFDSYYDASKENIIETERFFAENTVVLDYQKQLKITFQKYSPNRYHEAYSLINNKDWKALYLRYCRDEKHWNWRIYCFKNFLRRFIFKELRGTVIFVLNIFHLKEPIKCLLRWISN